MSMPDVTAVQKPQQAPLGLDQQPLFELGLREVRAYARELWTDHNIHDPGITMLELLCYALTDLCYRACFSIEDLLAVADDNKRNMASQFFKARQALPNGPLTELDYRKLLIDVEGVRNAWIHPVAPAPTMSMSSTSHFTQPRLSARIGSRSMRSADKSSVESVNG